MKENNNIPEPEIFTAEIEDTIDDLFKPSKKIEIDPLTQEIKELSGEPAEAPQESKEDSPVEFEVSPDKAAPAEAEAPDGATADSPQAQVEKSETVLELDLELELEEADAAETPAGDKTEQAAEQEAVPEKAEGKPAGITDIGQRLEQLNQQLFTIEWEVTEPQLHQTLDLLGSLLAAPEINAQARARSILELMEKVLLNIQFHPEKVPATAPSILKKSTRHLTDILSGKDEKKDETENLLAELRALIEKPDKTTTEEEPLFLDESALVQEKTEEKEEDILPPEPPKQAPKEAPEEKTAVARTEAGPALPENGLELLRQHLAELKKCVNRIEPLENLLSKTPGMEKLYRFQHDIRLSLEGQISELSRFFFKDEELDLPEASLSERDTEDYTKDLSADQKPCPWKEVLTVNIDGLEIGFPADQLVYASGPPWYAKSAIKKAEALALSKLKPWPWSKLKGLFQGRLKEMDDSTLSSMSFPVIRQLGGQELPVPASFNVIMLFDGSSGAVLLAEEKPLKIEVPGDAECTKEQADGFAGEINTHGNRIRVATASSLNKV